MSTKKEPVEQLSAADRKTYVKSGGNKCPFCKDENYMETNGHDADCNYDAKYVQCEKCGAEWTEIFILSNIEITTRPTKEYKVTP